MKLMEDYNLLFTCKKKCRASMWLGSGGKTHSWTLIEDLQFTCCRDVEQSLLAFSSGDFAHRNRVECDCRKSFNIDISKYISDLLYGEDRPPYAHRNRQKNRQTNRKQSSTNMHTNTH